MASARTLRRILAAPLLVALAACGASSSTGGPTGGAALSATPVAGATSQTPTAPAFPVTVTGANATITLAQAPTQIVSLSPTATEMLFAIGAGTQVKAVDDNSTYPADAPRTKLSSFEPNAEAVAGYKPDLVVISNDANGLLDALEKLQIPAILLPAASTLDDTYAQLDTLGRVTGHLADAEKVAQQTKERIAAAVASVATPATPLKVYHELDQTYYSATSSTFLGSIYTMFGLKDIADAAKNASGGYPQLSAEFVVKSAPDLIVLADSRCCGQTPATVAKRPAFASVPAVKNGKVIAVDDDIASRWGPRTADFAEAVAAALRG